MKKYSKNIYNNRNYKGKKLKKYSTKKMIISKIIDLTDCDEVVDNVGIKCIINQELINKVFRAKKRFKNKYDSQANKVYIYKSIKPMSKTFLLKII